MTETQLQRLVSAGFSIEITEMKTGRVETYKQGDNGVMTKKTSQVTKDISDIEAYKRFTTLSGIDQVEVNKHGKIIKINEVA